LSSLIIKKLKLRTARWIGLTDICKLLRMYTGELGDGQWWLISISKPRLIEPEADIVLAAVAQKRWDQRRYHAIM